MINDTITLANGVKIPQLGLGTWMIEDGKVAKAVRAATEIGYRHIDTAQAYQNERGVGEGVKSSGVARDELFVTTKLDAGIKDYEKAKASIDGSLKTLDLDHIDLMIIHSPQPWQNFHDDDRFFEGNVEAWRALEEAYQAGKLRAIGVSNFQKEDVDNLLQNSTVKPMINQILAHVSNTPFDLIDYLKSNDIAVEAYSPVGHGKILDNADIRVLADSYGVTIPQVAIRYLLQLDLIALPKTANPDHMRNNADVAFEISEADMAKLKNLVPIKDYGDASNFPVYTKKSGQ